MTENKGVAATLILLGAAVGAALVLLVILAFPVGLFALLMAGAIYGLWSAIRYALN